MLWHFCHSFVYHSECYHEDDNSLILPSHIFPNLQIFPHFHVLKVPPILYLHFIFLVPCQSWCHLSNLAYLFSAITCPPVPTWDGKLVVLSGISPGDTVNCSCAQNRTFPGEEPYINATCQDNGDWSVTIPECIGKKWKFLFSVKPHKLKIHALESHKLKKTCVSCILCGIPMN